jgi:hypothetical protein
MEFSIRPVAEVSAVSGKAFAPGDRVWSCLYRGEDGALGRLDALEEERDGLELPEAVLCQWSHRIREPALTEADQRRADLQSAEEVFLSLYEETEAETADDPARDQLKFFLALQLERKRILRPLGGGRYRHMPSRRELAVPQLELTPELVAGFLGPDGAAGREGVPTGLQNT